MKKQNKTTIAKLSEKFDKQLLTILSQELQAIKGAKNKIVNDFSAGPDRQLLVA